MTKRIYSFFLLGLVFSFVVLSVSAQSEESTTINGGVLNGKAIILPKPAYPAAAGAVSARGDVQVEVIIDEGGNVKKAVAVSGHVLLRAAAEKAAVGATFSPTVLSGKAVKVKGILIYNFTGSEKPEISGGIVNGKATSLVKPDYPAEARASKASGIVEVGVVIDEKGNVTSAKAISGDPLLYKASEEAALKSKFSNSQIDGKGVKSTGVVVYNFVADDEAKNTADSKASNHPDKKSSGLFIRGGVINGKAINLPTPEIPPAAKAVGASGTVNVQVIVNEEGKVVTANATSGHALLRTSAEKAALDATFSPTKVNDKPAIVEGIIVYNFTLPKKEKN